MKLERINGRNKVIVEEGDTFNNPSSVCGLTIHELHLPKKFDYNFKGNQELLDCLLSCLCSARGHKLVYYESYPEFDKMVEEQTQSDPHGFPKRSPLDPVI